MRERQVVIGVGGWLVVIFCALGLALVAWPSGRAAAGIARPDDLVVSAGTLESVKVVGDSGRVDRHHAIVIRGRVTSGGLFTATLPYLNGQIRMIWIKGQSGFTMGNATLDLDLIYDDPHLIATTATVTMSSESGFNGGGTETAAWATPTAVFGAACPVKIKIAGATAGGRFAMMIMVRVTG